MYKMFNYALPPFDTREMWRQTERYFGAKFWLVKDSLLDMELDKLLKDKSIVKSTYVF